MFKCVKLYSNDETNNYVLHFFSNVRSTMYNVHHTSHIQTQFCQESYGRKLKKSTWQSAKKLYTTLQICSFKNSFCKIVNILKEIEKKEIVTKSFSEKKSCR